MTINDQNINKKEMLHIGNVLKGTYRIERCLSSGGFGNTYVATNIEFEEVVAIKEFFIKGVTQRDANNTTVSVSNTQNKFLFEEQMQKFKKEARRLRKLNNPHIVKVYDLFEENGTAYYVMDYINGENLSEKLKRQQKPLSEAEVMKYLPQILDALACVHQEGLWHLDLKPANIMVDRQGNITLIDFGASKQRSAKGGATTSTAVSYTNGFAPREQMEQNLEKFGPWTDIYALGATLYNLLTNKKPPLPSDIDDDRSTDKHLALPMPDSISEKTKRLILSMLTTDRIDRPQTIEEVWKMMGVDGTTIGKRDTFGVGTKSMYEVVNNKEKELTLMSDGVSDETIRGLEEVERINKTNELVSPHNEEFKDSTIKVNDNVLQPVDSTKPTGLSAPDKKVTVMQRFWIPLILIAVVAIIVIVINENNKIGYSFFGCPDDNHPHAIDLGLPSGTKWACCNVGADKPEEYGGYYAWGETEEKDYYHWSSYAHCDGSVETCYNLGRDIADTEYDVAHVKCGGEWSMPTYSQIKELLDNCTYEWINHKRMKGGKFTGPNGNFIFLPVAGNRWNESVNYSDYYGIYWSSTQDTQDSDNAYNLYISSGSAYCNNYGRARSIGQSVRPIINN